MSILLTEIVFFIFNVRWVETFKFHLVIFNMLIIEIFFLRKWSIYEQIGNLQIQDSEAISDEDQVMLLEASQQQQLIDGP